MAYSGPGKLSAVDAILAEAADLVALQQIAKLNTAHLADDSALPSSLESRFRKLKSLPAAAAPAPVKTLSRSVTTPDHHLPQPNPTPQPQLPTLPPAVQVQEAEEHRGKKDNSPPQQQIRPPVDAVPTVHDDDDDLDRLFGGGRGRPMLRERNRGRDHHDGSASPPPPRQACCFGFSPMKKPPPHQRRTPPTKSKKKVHGPAAGDRDVLGIDAAADNKRMVTELKEQQRKLDKALQEQLEVSRETAKMARWIKQASARMTNTAAVDDLLSDCEEDDDFK
jgi:hypothetical protein